MEAIARFRQPGAFECGAPHAAIEVRFVDWGAAHGGEDELVGRVSLTLQRTSRHHLERRQHGGKEGDRTRSSLCLRPLQLPARVGALDPDEPPLAADVPPAEGPKLAEAKTSAERDVDEIGVKEIRFVS